MGLFWLDNFKKMAYEYSHKLKDMRHGLFGHVPFHHKTGLLPFLYHLYSPYFACGIPNCQHCGNCQHYCNTHCGTNPCNSKMPETQSMAIDTKAEVSVDSNVLTNLSDAAVDSNTQMPADSDISLDNAEAPIDNSVSADSQNQIYITNNLRNLHTLCNEEISALDILHDLSPSSELKKQVSVLRELKQQSQKTIQNVWTEHMSLDLDELLNS